MTEEEIKKADEQGMKEAERMLATYKDNPLTVTVDYADMDRVINGMCFRVVEWDKTDKEKCTISLMPIR